MPHYQVYHVTFLLLRESGPPELVVVAEQGDIRAESLWHLLRTLAVDFREELETCDGLEIKLENLV